MQVDIDIKLTDAAVKELRRVKDENDLGKDTLVRLAAKAGGCAGYMYDLQLINENEVEGDSDITEEYDGITLVIDKKSLLFLDGTTIDWIEDLNQRGFKFDNPQAQRGCGCGQSFG